MGGGVVGEGVVARIRPTDKVKDREAMTDRKNKEMHTETF